MGNESKIEIPRSKSDVGGFCRSASGGLPVSPLNENPGSEPGQPCILISRIKNGDKTRKNRQEIPLLPLTGVVSQV